MKQLRNILTAAFLALCAARAAAGELAIRILPHDVLGVGDVMRIRITSPVTGWLHVFDVRADGEITRLFPGQCNHGRRIRAGRPLTIPSRASGCEFVSDAPGKGRIAVIVTREKTPLRELAAALPPSGAEKAAVQADDANWRTIEILPWPPQERPAANSATRAKPEDMKSALERLTSAKSGKGEDWIAAAAPYEIR